MSPAAPVPPPPAHAPSTPAPALAYLDPSVLVRSYLADEPGHRSARDLIEGDTLLVTATFALVEAVSALSRAGRRRHLPEIDILIGKLYEEVSADGPIMLTRPDPAETENAAVTLVRHHDLRSMEAMHLAVAGLAVRPLAAPGEPVGFASACPDQLDAAQRLGFVPLTP